MFEPNELGQRRNDLATALRELRRASGLTGDRLAARSGISQSKISKIETGKVLPSAVDVERILCALDASPDMIEEITSLTRLANTQFQDWRSTLRRGLHHRQRELAAIEADSTELCYFLPTMITGLLHTPEYARASLAGNPGDLTQAIAKRLERQAVLYDRSKSFTFVLTEAAVRWPLCPADVMAVQLGRLASLAALPNIRLGVIPMAQPHLPEGPLSTFTVYDSRLATAEVFSGAIIMRDPRDIAYHRERFSLFVSHARFGDEAIELLTEWADKFRHGN
ncbi:helix-turn-helix transcriptional regulator [Nonomuraea sp. NPDC026600]|uniref:helix-turn-helix domain-containing protein n=1 Tax=Nonomuraea sp. NPDC026600 TaxID=3155363 RepID=UPI003403E68E